MTSVFFLKALPLILLGIFSLSIIAELFWRVFARSRAVGESTNATDAAAALRIAGLALLVFGTTVLPSLAPLASALQAYQASISLLVLALVALFGSKKYKQPDVVVFVLFSALASIYLLNSSDILTIFFVLELLNSLILYSFFFTASYSGAGHSNAAARISTSCVYQFTLNFFSSIVLYIGLISYIGATGGSSLIHAFLWSAHPYAAYSVSLFISAFLLKFGTGPWVFFKINVYRNMNFQLVLLYSAAYILIIFILFLNLLFLFGAPLSPFAAILVSGVVMAASTLFCSFAFQNPNIFVFISFSSLINLSVFVLQAVTVS